MNDLDDMLAEHDAAQPQPATPEEPMTEENQVIAQPVHEEALQAALAEPPEETVADIIQETVAEQATIVAAEAPPPAPAPEKHKPTPPKPTATTGLAHYVDPDQFRRDTAISEHNLDQAMLEQSGLRAYYNAQAAYAEAQAARAKAKFEILEAKLYEEYRKALNKDAADTGAKVTEKLIESHVKMDDRWLKGKSYMIEAQTIADVNKGISYSMADRRDMLIQLGSDRREEFKGQTRILASDAEKQSLADRARNAGKGH